MNRHNNYSNYIDGSDLILKIHRLEIKLYKNSFNQFQKDYLNNSLLNLNSIIKNLNMEQTMTPEVYDKLDILIDTFGDLINDEVRSFRMTPTMTPKVTPSIERVRSIDKGKYDKITFKPANELIRGNMNRSLSQASQISQISSHSSIHSSTSQTSISQQRRRYQYTPGLNQQKFLDNEDGFHHLKTNFPPSNRDKSFDSVFLD
ncbi:hypothetical protein CLIB1444_03S10440 [[Candida] jaroonii]|uniref:Uncharacterized protein n=1 Tax=[Candida] jaroonii TaxID=467808 RepID=A0ACA9Y6P0_9ASCO|nr:hypothetical protein CLIB1444_03S10440 [[Candida] jaroonii]